MNAGKIIAEAAQVMSTDFWHLYVAKILEKKQFAEDRYREDIFEQEQWIRHAVFQGRLKALDDILSLPDSILRDMKGETRE